jgi:hypothetical protein
MLAESFGTPKKMGFRARTFAAALRLKSKGIWEEMESVPNEVAAVPELPALPLADVATPGAVAGPVPVAVVAPNRRMVGVGLWLRDLLVSAIASVLIITFLYQPVRVEGTSMLPRLEDRDRLFINKFVYHVSAIERGDVVVFHYPRDPEKSYIKRVIALPGDNLRIDHGTVWLNGHALPEPIWSYRPTPTS